MEYKVSIIVPVYNVEKYLKRCLDSLICQTLREIEIILIDDGSTDKSAEICDKYFKMDDRIVVKYQENQGAGQARNLGMKLAKGEYVAFVDSDDDVDIDFYEKLYESAKKFNSDMVMARMQDIGRDGKIIRQQKDIPSKEVFYKEEIKENILYNVVSKVNDNVEVGMSASNAIYRKKIIDDFGIRFCSVKQFEDGIFNLEFINQCKIISGVNGTYYHYNSDNTSSVTRNYLRNRFEKLKESYDKITYTVEQVGIYQEVIEKINEVFIGNVRACIKQEGINSKKEAILNIKKICEDDLLQKLLHTKYEQSFQQRIFDFLIKRNFSYMLYCIAKIVS